MPVNVAVKSVKVTDRFNVFGSGGGHCQRIDTVRLHPGCDNMFSYGP